MLLLSAAKFPVRQSPAMENHVDTPPVNSTPKVDGLAAKENHVPVQRQGS